MLNKLPARLVESRRRRRRAAQMSPAGESPGRHSPRPKTPTEAGGYGGAGDVSETEEEATTPQSSLLEE